MRYWQKRDELSGIGVQPLRQALGSMLPEAQSHLFLPELHAIFPGLKDYSLWCWDYHCWQMELRREIRCLGEVRMSDTLLEIRAFEYRVSRS